MSEQAAQQTSILCFLGLHGHTHAHTHVHMCICTHTLMHAFTLKKSLSKGCALYFGGTRQSNKSGGHCVSGQHIVFLQASQPTEESFSLCPFCALQNQERKHRTYVYVLIVTEVLEDWEDSVNIGKSRQDSGQLPHQPIVSRHLLE